MAGVRLRLMSKHLHLVVPDLLLPQAVGKQLCDGLHLPALEKILARAKTEPLPSTSLEGWLCDAFGVPGQGVAPITLLADELEPGEHYWLRADPVHLRIVHDQLVLHPAAQVGADEAQQLCAALNAHFAGDGLHFAAPHPLRWYLRLVDDPGIATVSLPQMGGKDVHREMPRGDQGLRWHGFLNEIQMLLHAHPLNEVREQRGDWQINGVWLWGGGRAAAPLRSPATRMCTDSALAGAFARVAGLPAAPLPGEDGPDDCIGNGQGTSLIIWDGLHAALQIGDAAGWRESLQHFEQRCAWPLLQALSSGRIAGITLDALQETGSRRFELTRRDVFKLWRRVKRLDRYFLV